MPIVTFVNEKKKVQCAEGANLRKIARSAGVKLYNGMNGYGAKLNEYFNCLGFGHCGTCRVLITKGMDQTSPKGVVERLRLGMSLAYIGNEQTMRLACRTRVMGDMEVVTRPEFNLTGENFFS